MDILGEFQRVKDDQFTIANENRSTGLFLAVKCNEEESKLVYDGVDHNYLIAQIFRALGDNAYHIVHDISGSLTLSEFLNTSCSSLVYQIPSSKPQIQPKPRRAMSDTLKLIVRDLFLVVISAANSDVKLKMSLDDIFIRKGELPRLEAIAQGTSVGGDAWGFTTNKDGKKIKLSAWDMLDRVLIAMLEKCSIDVDDSDVSSMRDSLKLGLLPRERMRRLHTHTFWTQRIKIGVLFAVGEMVEATQSVRFGTKETTKTLSQWRKLVQADCLLEEMEESFRKHEENKAHNKTHYKDHNLDVTVQEANSFLFFLRWTMLHFWTMKQKVPTCTFPDRKRLHLHFEMIMPKQMDEVYRVSQDFLAKSFSFF